MKIDHQDWYFEHQRPHINAFEIPLEGTLYIDHDEQTIAVNPGELYFLPAGEYNRLSVKADTAFSKISIGFCGCCFGTFYNNLFGKQRRVSIGKIQQSFYDKLRELYALLEAHSEADIPLIVADGAWLLMEVARHVHREIPDSLSEAIRLFEFNFGDSQCIAKAAATLKLSKYQLTKLFQTHLKVTPKQYLIDLRMKKAAEILQTGNTLIKETARLSGYASARIFARVFRKTYGVSPLKFRTGHCP